MNACTAHVRQLAYIFYQSFIIPMDGLRPAGALGTKAANGAGAAKRFHGPFSPALDPELFPCLLEAHVKQVISRMAGHGTDAHLPAAVNMK